VAERSLALSRRIPLTNLAWKDLPIWLIGMFFVVLWAAPFVWMVSTSFKPSSQVMTAQVEWLPRQWTLEKLRQGPHAIPGRNLGAEQPRRRGAVDRDVRAVRRHGRLCAGAPAVPGAAISSS